MGPAPPAEKKAKAKKKPRKACRAEPALLINLRSGSLGSRFFLRPPPPRLGLRIRRNWGIVTSVMKTLFTLTVAALALAAFATTTFAGSCGGCGDGKKKDGDKTEQGSQS